MDLMKTISLMLKKDILNNKKYKLYDILSNRADFYLIGSILLCSVKIACFNQ